MVESSILWNYLADFLSPSSKNKRINSEKISYIFSKKAFLIFRKSTLKNIHIFIYIYRNGNPDSPQKLNKTFQNFIAPEKLNKTFYALNKNFLYY